MGVIKLVIAGLASIYLLVIAVFYLFQERFIFLPEVLDEEYQFDFPFQFEERNFSMKDGAVINAIHARIPDPKGVIFYQHGNAGNLNRWGDVSVTFTDLGYDIVVYDFRGYGKSTGKRSMKALFDDAQYIYNTLVREYGEKNIVLYGRSLGTGIASWLAGKNKPSKLILETPYYSLVDVAEHYYPIFPIKQLIRYPLESHRYLRTTEVPIHIFHGTKDEIVPYKSGHKLYESIREDKNVELITIEGGYHNDLGLHEAYGDRLEAILTDN